MHKITLQEIFDLAWQKFIVEDAPPAMSCDCTCQYTTADGRHCAVGLALAKYGYEPDGSPVASFLAKNHPEWFEPAQIDQLDAIQADLHDDLTCGNRWMYGLETRKERYKEVAIRLGLRIPE